MASGRRVQASLGRFLRGWMGAAFAACALLAAPAYDAWAWTSMIGSTHGAIAGAALGNTSSAEFIAYLGLNAGSISNYAQQHEPWGALPPHVYFWAMINPGGGVRYYNDVGYIGESHNRDGGSWPGTYDRSVDVLGVLLHCAGDCAVFLGHSPSTDWFTDTEGYEIMLELAGNNRSGTSWMSPVLSFRDGTWPRYVYTGVPVNEAHKLYLDTQANFLLWESLSEDQKTMGGSELNDVAELAIKTGKRWAEAVLLDFLKTCVLKPPQASLACFQLAGPSLTVNSGSMLSFRYQVDGDRQITDLALGPTVVHLGPSHPFNLAQSGDTALVTFDTPGNTTASITAAHNFFNLGQSASAAIAVSVVPRPQAILTSDAVDVNGDGIYEWILAGGNTLTIQDLSTGQIEQKILEIRNSGNEVLATYLDPVTVQWEIPGVGLYDLTTTVSNSYYGPHTHACTLRLRAVEEASELTPGPTAAVTPQPFPTLTPTLTPAGESAAQDFFIYPNPAKNKAVFILLGEPGAKVKITLFNSFGERVGFLEGQIGADRRLTLTWNCGQAAPGVYLARLLIGGREARKWKVAVVR